MSENGEVKKKNPAVLLVDDVPKNLQVLGSTLSKEGYRIAAAMNGKKALEMIEKTRPDLILLDVMMPEMDGFETCQILKSRPETRDIPVIFLTAKTETEDIIKGFELGAVDYISKPFNSSELLVRVRTHLDLQEKKEQLAEQNEIISRISNERKELLHVLCHDLSNPFSSIVSIMEIVKFAPDYQEWKKHLLTLAHNGLDIIALIRKIRAIEDKKMDLQLNPVKLNLLVDDSHLALSPKFQQKKIQLESDIDESIQVMVEEVSFLNSVLNNIFTNAIKFSFPEGKISITAKVQQGVVTFTVRDYGIGIPEKLLNDLFNINKATSRDGTEGEPGTGFGMPLIKKFVEAYGGSIRVESKEKSDDNPDHGTSIILTLQEAK